MSGLRQLCVGCKKSATTIGVFTVRDRTYSTVLGSTIRKGKSRQSCAQTLSYTRYGKRRAVQEGQQGPWSQCRSRDERRTSIWKSWPSDERCIEAPRTAAYAAVTLRPVQAPGMPLPGRDRAPRGSPSSCGALFDLLDSPATTRQTTNKKARHFFRSFFPLFFFQLRGPTTQQQGGGSELSPERTDHQPQVVSSTSRTDEIIKRKKMSSASLKKRKPANGTNGKAAAGSSTTKKRKVNAATQAKEDEVIALALLHRAPREQLEKWVLSAHSSQEILHMLGDHKDLQRVSVIRGSGPNFTPIELRQGESTGMFDILNDGSLEEIFSYFSTCTISEI